jgi:hypothetical protein
MGRFDGKVVFIIGAARGQGRTSSAAAVVSMRNNAHYVASKHGVVGLMNQCGGPLPHWRAIAGGRRLHHALKRAPLPGGTAPTPLG